MKTPVLGRCLVALATLVAPAVFLPPRASGIEVCADNWADVTVPLAPGVNVPDSTVRVLVPEGYNPADTATRYPVLYLLHGVGDTYATWVQNTDVEEFCDDHPLIIVMPDGGKNASAGWYSDWADGSRQWETFHTGVLVDWVDANYNTLDDGHRAVAGLSMGGFGAMKYAARHPGEFAAAASFSGAVDTMYGYPASGPFFHALGPVAGTPGPGVWGNQVLDEDAWRAHNPTDRAGQLAGVALFVTTGDGTPVVRPPESPQGSVDANERFIADMNRNFIAALNRAGVAHQDRFEPGGRHAWPHWQAALHWALPQIVAVIDATP